MSQETRNETRAVCQPLVRQLPLALLAMGLLAAPTNAVAQEAARPGPVDGTTIQAEGEAQAKVQNDLLAIDLTLEREGALLPPLHEEVQKEADGALDKAKSNPDVQVKTAGYSVQPVYERERIARQRAIYRISLETKKFDVGLALAAAMQPFQVSNLTFSVSPDRRKATEKTLLEEAIADLRDNLGIAANALGAKTIAITSLTVGARQYNPVQPQIMVRPAMAMAVESAAPVAAEAGESQVHITVSGSALVK